MANAYQRLRHRHSILACGLLLLIALVNIHALSRGWRFHPDEALYTTFARNAAVKGDWLLHGPLDKPPLTIYSSAFFMMLVGVQPIDNGVLDLDMYRGEFAARLPNVFAAIISVSIVFRLALAVYPTERSRCTAALVAVALTGLSPFVVAFSATAFTDMFLLLLLLLSWWMSARGQPAWSGVFFACAFASKPQAVLCLPLILSFAWWKHNITKYTVLRFILPIVGGLILLIAWSSARNEVDVWTLARAHYISPRLASADEILPRIREWAGYAGYLLGPGWLTAVFVLLALPMIAFQRHKTDTILIFWLLAYAALHIFTTIEIYDRYLLLALVPVALLVARGLSLLVERVRAQLTPSSYSHHRLYRLLGLAISAVVFMSLLYAGWGASEGRVPLAAHGEGRQEIDTIARYLNSKPVATVIYDPWLGWDLGYYMGVWSDKRRVYYPSPETLVEDALTLQETGARYLVGKSETETRPWLDALENAGFDVAEEYHAGRFIVYALIPPMTDADASTAGASLQGPGSGDD